MSEHTPDLETKSGDELLGVLVEEFLRRYRSGEHPSIDEYTNKHPELADRIRELFPAVIVMEQPVIGATVDLGPAAERVGQTIGRYKLLERIGEGGFGVVYMAEQQHPVRRKVALKVIRPGVDTLQVIARFEAERQALALMDHENIAKVLDAGATESGRPYFVMELVHGVPITEFCDKNQLPTHQRLELFIQVCRAVQHAHTKGIIHRDIKPTNVLVTLHEGVPAPKVIDFGIAKATGQQLTEKTLFTNFAQMVGTPLYMSPEQAEMTSVDVDTRSDVYSLGVLLYELLTGTTPVDNERLKQAAFDEVRRIIREEDPPRPSTRLSTMGEQARSILAAQRRCDPKQLGRLMRGELDWIVMKSLEKERARRYETPNGLARDIEHYLRDETVEACPPSAAYRLKKFARRNKGPMLAASLVLLALAAGIVGTAWQAVQAEQARRAEAERAEGERLAKERAEANFALANEAVEKFLVTVTDDPELMRADLIPLRRKLLESALPFFQKIAAQKSDDPDVQAARAVAYLRLALVHEALGEYEAAKQDSEATRDIFTRLTADFPAVPKYRHGLANGEHNLALSLNNLGMNEEAEAGYRRAVAIMEQLTTDSPTEAQRKDLAMGYRDLGILLQEIGKWPKAEAAYRRALSIQEKLAADFPDKPEYQSALSASHNNLGFVLAELGKNEEAEAAYRRAIDIQEKLAAKFRTDPEAIRDRASHHANFGNLLSRLEKYEEAEASLRRAVEIQEKLVAEFPSPLNRMQLSNCHINLGVLHSQKGEHEKAAAAYQHALGIHEKLAADFPNVPEYRQRLSGSLGCLGNALSSLGKRQEAEAAYREALQIDEKLVAEFPTVPDYGVALGGDYCNFGILLIDSGQPEASLDWFKKAIARLEAVLAKEPRLYSAREFLRNSHGGRADALYALGRRAEALESQEKALALNTEMLGPSHPNRIRSMDAAINNYVVTGRFDDALRLLKEILALRQQTLGPDDPETLGAMANVAIGYVNLGRQEEALKLREEVLALMKAKIPEHPYTLTTMGNLANSYAVLGRPHDALTLRQETLALRKAKLGPDHSDTLLSMHDLAASLISCDRGSAAIPLIDECARRAEGKAVDPRLVPSLFDLRLRHFEKQRDTSGCRTTAEMWEHMNRTDAVGLYAAACYRAVTAAVLRATDASKGAQSIAAEADRAMDWLAKAVAAGYSDVAHIEKDEDLDILRDRAEFQQLIARLKAQAAGKARVSGGGER